MNKHKEATYHRYHIEIKHASHIVPHPHRFHVKVKKLGLAKLLLKEILHFRGNWKVISSRPCVYGVFSGPVGGFAPREKLCVGCLRCTTEHPEFVTVSHNEERKKLGDTYFLPELIDTVVNEAETGRIPIKGAGYRGTFGGKGWDGMWTDMSEIVRPTRDGIHGREFISTDVDIGGKPPYLKFDAQHRPIGAMPHTHGIPLPLLFDTLPSNVLTEKLCHSVAKAAQKLQTFAILPLKKIKEFSLRESSVIPLIYPHEYEQFNQCHLSPVMLELEGWDEKVYQDFRLHYPNSQLILRTDFESDLLAYYKAGVRTFHLIADYHGRGRDGKFVLDLIKKAHNSFVKAKCRNEVTLLGSGGIIAAEHVPKAMICGLDAIVLDTPVLVALQAKFHGDCRNREECHFELPAQLTVEWGQQRLKNLACAWRDQLLEIMGAMGIREVRRIRGEMGRAMFQHDLEREAFSGITGYAE